MSVPRLRRLWSLAFHSWGWLLAGWTAFLAVEAVWWVQILPLEAVICASFAGLLNLLGLWILANNERLVREPKAIAQSQQWALKAPNAPAGQCPICGMDDLDQLAADDRFMERGERAKVVPYGRRRAHADCAELSPYVPTAADKRREEIKQWREEDEFYERQARLAVEETWPFLMSAMKPGWREIRVFHEPAQKHYLLQSTDLRHSEILTVESRRRAGDGFGWLVSLTERPVHAFPAETKLVPLDSKRLWNWTESRPYTRTELGMCDCGYGPTRDPMLAQFLALDSARFEATLKSITDPESILRMLGKGF